MATGQNLRQRYEAGEKINQASDSYGILTRKVSGTDETSKVILQEKLLTPNTEKTTAMTRDSRVTVLEGTGDSKTAKKTPSKTLMAGPLEETNNSLLSEYLLMNVKRAGSVTPNFDNSKAFKSKNEDLSLGNRQVGVRCPTNSNSITLTGDSKVIIGANSCAFSLFAKINTTATAGSIISGNHTSGGTNYFGLVTTVSGQIHLYAVDSAGLTTSPSYVNTPIDSTKYTHLVCVLDRTSGKTRLYKNNVLVGEATLNGSFDSITATTFRIITQTLGVSADILRFDWLNFAPTASEVALLWNNGRPDTFIIPDAWKWGSNTEKVTNGTFDSDTGWSKDAGWTISDGKARINSSTQFATIRQPAAYLKNGYYLTRFTISDYVSGGVAIQLGATANYKIGSTRNSNGTFEEILYVPDVPSTQNIYLNYNTGASCQLSIDAVSVIQIGSVFSLEPRGINVPPMLTSSEVTTITKGLPYEISTPSTTYFTVYGALDSAIGTRFLANQTVATLPNSAKVKQCAVSNGTGEGWKDSGENGLNATVSNHPLAVLTQVETKQGDGVLLESSRQQLSSITNASNSNTIGTVERMIVNTKRSDYSEGLEIKLGELKNHQLGSFISFNGTTNYLTIPANANLNLGDGAGNDFPFCLIEQIYLIPNGTVQRIETNGTSLSNREYALFLDTDNCLKFFIAGVSTSSLNLATINALTEGLYNICLSYDGSKSETGLNLLLNGVAVPVTRIKSGSYNGVTVTDTPTKIGINYDATGDRLASGSKLFGRLCLNFVPDSNIIKNFLNNLDLLNAQIPDLYKWGSRLDLVTNGNCESALPTVSGNFFVASGGANSQSNEQAHARTYSLKYTGNGSTATYTKITSPAVFTIGKRYRLVFWAYIPSGNSAIQTLSVINGSVTVGSTISTKGSWQQFIAEFIATATTFRIDSSNTVTSEVFYIDDISITKLGVISDHRPAGMSSDSTGTLLSLIDQSSNTLNATPNGSIQIGYGVWEQIKGEGAFKDKEDSRFIDAAGVNTSYFYMLPPKWFVETCILYNYGTGSVTIKIGSTNGGAEYVSAKTLNAGECIPFNVPDVKNPYHLTNFQDFWISSSSWGNGKIKAEFVLKKSKNTW